MMIAPAARSFADYGGVIGGHIAFQGGRPGGGRQAGHLDIVLDRDRHASQRLAVAAPLVRGIEGAGGLHGAGLIERDEGIQFGAGFCPRQRGRNQRHARVFAGTNIGRRLRRGQMIEIDGRFRLSAARGAGR